jgi:hypothetical protein
MPESVAKRIADQRTPPPVSGLHMLATSVIDWSQIENPPWSEIEAGLEAMGRIGGRLPPPSAKSFDRAVAYEDRD